MWLYILAVPLLVYLAICAVLFFGQTALLFPASSVGPGDSLPPRAERLELRAASGERLAGVHIPSARPGAERLLILGFGGNGWNADSVAVFLAGLYPEADTIAFHYRGYAPSEGRPSSAALLADAPLIHDFARARLRPARTVAIGFSLGSGVAAALAAERPLDGLILVTPFDSLGRVAAGHYRWLPVQLLFRHRMDAAGALAGQAVPVAILAGGRDTLIPPERTDSLRHSISTLAYDRTIDAGHNDIYQHPAFAPAMREAMARLQR